MKELFIASIALTLAIVVGALVILYDAWWFSFIWDWFAVPLGAPVLTVGQLAMAISVVCFPIGMSLAPVVVKTMQMETSSIKDAAYSIFYGLLYAPVAVAVAWVIKAFL